MIQLKSYLIDIYVALIQRGIRKIETIPVDYQVVVAEKIAEKEEEKLKEEEKRNNK